MTTTGEDQVLRPRDGGVDLQGHPGVTGLSQSEEWKSGQDLRGTLL